MKALPDEYENLTTLKRLSLDVELLGSFNNELLSWATTLESLEFDGGKKWEVCVSGGECIYTYCTLVYYIECARGAGAGAWDVMKNMKNWNSQIWWIFTYSIYLQKV